MDNSYTVYMHTCPNGKKYIGITRISVYKRWRNDGAGYSTQQFFTRAIQKYGWHNIMHEILFENMTREEAEHKEIELIALHKSNDPKYGYNVTSGGDGSSGIIGEHHHSFGKPRTDEVKQKLRMARIGKKASQETRCKMGEQRKGKPSAKGWKQAEKVIEGMRQRATGENNPFYGQTHTVESKRKMSDFAKTKTLSKNPNARKTAILIDNVEYEFSTRKECIEFLGISNSEFYRRIKNGKTQLTGGSDCLCWSI